MNIYIALLRGINVSGQKKIPMAELRDMLKKMDFKNVSSYIQSGNVVFSSDEDDTKVLQKEIRTEIFKIFGFDVQVLVKSKRQLEKIIHQNPYQDKEAIENKQIYFVLLQNIPDNNKAAILKKESYLSEDFMVKEDCVYLLCHNGYGKAKLNNNRIERKLEVDATTRNYRTMHKLLEMMEE